ncbi:glycosyltransferase family 2 protein [Sphingomonas sp. MG17]|uniref:Glycosyltransferase family 2 protein n=1 Tax=Sphingomonas tagetis TaxID=2949092 RepID=A0A9X2HLS2_9SPHN|nr:glycosyltransferase family 2 protein [Sphingomonas tagetis]MCP3730836.1 glycosyltransferase family 2 protein [Sphingomonas tagetis]
MLATIVIGRNEAASLAEALASAQGADAPVVYVDSASSDDSVAVARKAGIEVLSLSSPPMLSAARGRNAGLEWLDARHPETDFVQFLDGDCVLCSDFPGIAANLMLGDPDIAIVVGHLREQAPGSSIYSKLSMLEWSSDVGEIRDFGNLGGIMCARVSALRVVGGFNAEMIAGEDSELGVRISLAGFRVVKIDAEMATHDNGIRHFGAWWRRSVRAGHALAQRFALNGRSAVRDCRREFFSTLFWGIVLPAGALILAWPSRGASLLVCTAGYLVLALRIRRSLLRGGRTRAEANIGMGFGLLSKLANAVGLCRYLWNARTGGFRIIEYKGAAVRPRR